MRPIRQKRRLIAGVASAIGSAVLGWGTFTALAGAAPSTNPPNQGPPATNQPDGPQTANIPYVAWIGEHQRLVVCDPRIQTDPERGEGQFVTFAVEDWSGYQFQPPNPDGAEGVILGEEFQPGPAAFFESSQPAHGKDGCVATDYKSLNPGLARIRVAVKNRATGEVVFSHQFLAIWLQIGEVKAHEAGISASGSEVFQNELNGQGKENLATFLGDPEGNGEFVPSPFSNPSGSDHGLVQIRVTGTFPVLPGVPLSNLLKEPSYTLPEAWPTLAHVLASSEEETEPPGSDPHLWDIHGTPGEVNGEEETAVESGGNPAKVCTTGFTGAFSSTDNCNGTGAETPLNSKFSRVFGDLTSEGSGESATVGPFDPQSANETLLSDGRLNADDAPMPALRVDVSIAENKGEGDLGGVGQIEGTKKALVYSHSFNEATTAHNLYNPYYGAYIPATDRPKTNEVSGVTGPAHGGDFPGFLNNQSEPYTFWTSVQNSNPRYSGSTGCLRRRGAEPEYYETPGGDRTRTLYTDERGEAYVTYTPGDQFYFEHFPLFKGEAGEEERGKLIKNSNGGCDLKGLYQEVIGESSISATGIYPYEPVDYLPVTSESVVKKVRSQWEKDFFSFPKGPGAEEGNLRVIVAKAQDIDGKPIVDEKVCFHAQHEAAIKLFDGEIEDPTDLLKKGVRTYDFSGEEIVEGVNGTQFLCTLTNDEGLAAVELENSTYTSIDLGAEFSEESIFRDHNVGFPNNKASKEQEAAEKKQHEEEAAAEKKKHEEEAAAETKKHEEEAAIEKKHHEEEEAAKTKKQEEERAAETKRHEEEAAAEKKKHEEEVQKAEQEKKTEEEIKKKKEEFEKEEAANKKHREEEAEAAKKKAEEEEKAGKEKREAEEKAGKEKREAEEKVGKEKREKEEQAAKEKREREEKEAREKREGEQGSHPNAPSGGGPSTSSSSQSTSTTSPLNSPAPTVSFGPVSGTGATIASTKPLTKAQKLAKALKACRKGPKSKRAACEAKARKAYGAKAAKKRKK